MRIPIKIKSAFLFLLSIAFFQSVAQQNLNSSIFSHNDYAQPDPFFNAYKNKVGYIEADVFLKNDELFVAHVQREINKHKTLDSMYLIPLQQKIIDNNGWAYQDSTIALALMIDLKTEGKSTIQTLVEKLNRFQSLLTCKNLKIIISGNVPDPLLWKNIPSFIHIDGRPGISYTPDQLNRIALISTNFNSVAKWNGPGQLPKESQSKLEAIIKSVHGQGKKIRFWAAPDLENGWKTLLRLNVDVIGTDNVNTLVDFLRK